MRNNTIINFISSILILLCSTMVLNAGVYKWTDDDGNIHYGDRPKASAEEIKVRKRNKPDQKQNLHRQKRDRLLEVFDEERREKRSDKELAAQQKAERKSNCAEAMKNLEQFKAAGYLYNVDDDGNRSILEDKEHAQALEDAQDSVDRWCS